MDKKTFVEIKLNDNATLRIRQENIVASVATVDNRMDIYINGMNNPWHLQNVDTTAINATLWGN